MARGRSLFWLGSALVAISAAAWWAAVQDFGTVGFQEIRQETLAAGAAALILFGMFMVAGRLLHPRRPDAARSLVHLQTMASAFVAIGALAAIAGGFQSALVGLGLVGFGLTLALQRPILAVAGWASLVAGGSVRVGDRIRVGELTGDVLDITLFTTRLWEVGDKDSNTPGRPTGRVVTTSNAIFLEKPVANATSDTPVVFDEFVVNVAFEADLALAKRLLMEAGREVVDYGHHTNLAKSYRRLTKGLAMESDFPNHPIILEESKPSWMEYRLRYLVDARRAGRTQARLTRTWTELCVPHEEALPQVYPRSQPQAVGRTGRPLN